jgi:hypothetical protein
MKRLISAAIFIWLVLGWPGDLTVKKILSFSVILLTSWLFLPPFNSIGAKLMIAVYELIGSLLNCFFASLVGMGIGVIVLKFLPAPFLFSNALVGYLTACCIAAWLNSYNRVSQTVDQRRLVLTTALCGLVITGCAVSGSPMVMLVGVAVCIVLT